MPRTNTQTVCGFDIKKSINVTPDLLRVLQTLATRRIVYLQIDDSPEQNQLQSDLAGICDDVGLTVHFSNRYHSMVVLDEPHFEVMLGHKTLNRKTLPPREKGSWPPVKTPVPPMPEPPRPPLRTTNHHGKRLTTGTPNRRRT